MGRLTSQEFRRRFRRTLRIRDKFVEEFQLLTGPRREFVVAIGIKVDGSAIAVRLSRPLPKNLELPDSYEGVPIEIKVVGKIVPRSRTRKN